MQHVCNTVCTRGGNGRNRMLYRVERSEATRFPNKEGRGERKHSGCGQGSPRLHFHGLPVIHTTRAGVGGHTREGAAHRRGAQFLHIALGGRTQDRPCHARRAAHERPYSPVVLGVRDRRPQLGAACRRLRYFDLPDLQHRGTPRFLRDAAGTTQCRRRDRRLLRRRRDRDRPAGERQRADHRHQLGDAARAWIHRGREHRRHTGLHSRRAPPDQSGAPRHRLRAHEPRRLTALLRAAALRFVHGMLCRLGNLPHRDRGAGGSRIAFAAYSPTS